MVKRLIQNKKVYLGIGSNLGDRLSNIKKASILLTENENIKIIQQSSIYETEPVGYKNQPDFLNCIIEIKTCLSPQRLLRILQNIEKKLGRVRKIKWGPRTIDLDILLYGDVIVKGENLIIPHPQMHKREFVLVPLVEIAPEIIHPLKKRTILELYKKLPRIHKVKKLEN